MIIFLSEKLTELIISCMFAFSFIIHRLGQRWDGYSMLLENYIMDVGSAKEGMGVGNLKDHHDGQDGTEKENNERA